MPALRTEPDLYDLDGWRRYLEDLRSDPQDEWRDFEISLAEARIEVIVSTSAKTPVQAR